MTWLVLFIVTVSALPELRLRYQALRNETLQRRNDVHNEKLYNNLGVYTLEFGIGNPPQMQQALLDTGSSDLYVLATAARFCRSDRMSKGLTYDPVKSETSRWNETDFVQEFQDGDSAEGVFMHDTIHVAGMAIDNFSFGVASFATTNLGVFGMGMATDETPLIHGFISEPYANLPVILKQAGKIQHTAFSLWLNSWSYEHGSIVFGGLDMSRIRSVLFRFPLVETSCGLKNRYSVKLSELYLVSADNTQQRFARTSMPIDLDSGTSISRLPGVLLEPLWDGMSTEFSEILGSQVVPCSDIADGVGIGIVLSGVELVFPFRDIAIPLGPEYELCIPGFMEGDAIIGANMLRCLYVVHDLENLEIGLALADTAASISTAEHTYYTISTGIPIGFKAPLYSQSSCNWAYTTWKVTHYLFGTYPQTPLSQMIYPHLGNAAVSGFTRPFQWS